MAIVRSVHHKIGGHGGALYYNITGSEKPEGRAKDRKNWPSLMAMISKLP